MWTTLGGQLVGYHVIQFVLREDTIRPTSPPPHNEKMMGSLHTGKKIIVEPLMSASGEDLLTKRATLDNC